MATTCHACRSLDGKDATSPPHSQLRLIACRRKPTGPILSFRCQGCGAELANSPAWRIYLQADVAARYENAQAA